MVTGLAETIIEDEVGCGLFQVLVVLFVFIPLRVSAVFTFIFMSYGNYNPGWRCLDNDTLYQSYTNDSLQYPVTNVNTSVEYLKDFTCQQYGACERIEFNPESSTVVTEWGLVCDRAWISSLLISIQMVGNLLASFVAGYVNDRVGRRKTVYGALFVTALLNLLSSFSVSWQTLAVCRFFAGSSSAFFESVIYMYSSEFLTRKWRGPLAGIPGWAFGGIMFGVTSMLLKDWRHILIVSSVVCITSCLTVFWVPDSLRWLEVKGKKKEFKKTATKMAKFNRKELHTKCTEVFSLNQEQTAETSSDCSDKQRQYTVFDIFKHGYRIITLIVGFVWLSLSFIYYAISFGIKALNGNFYINLILLYTILIPFAIFPFFAPNLLGRRLASCTFMVLVSVCLFAATVFECVTVDFTRMIVTLVLVLLAEVGIETTWSIQQTHTIEIYPTVVRGMAINWASLMARVGGICAPFMIPRDSSTVYLWYLTMACQGLVCCFLIARLPETRGKALKETFSVTSLEIVVKHNGGDGAAEENVSGEDNNAG